MWACSNKPHAQPLPLIRDGKSSRIYTRHLIHRRVKVQLRSPNPRAFTLLHHGQPVIIQEDILALAEIARSSGYSMESVVSVGDTALETIPILRIIGVGALFAKTA